MLDTIIIAIQTLRGSQFQKDTLAYCDLNDFWCGFTFWDCNCQLQLTNDWFTCLHRCAKRVNVTGGVWDG